MMTSIETYVRRGRGTLRQWAVDPKMRLGARLLGSFAAGLVLSAAGLAHSPLPLPLGLLLSVNGWPAVLLAGGGCAGYWLFWGQAGYQGMVWLGAGLLLALARRPIVRNSPLLMPALSGFLVSAAGLAFQVWLGDQTPVPIYLLRVALGVGSTLLFPKAMEGREPAARWLVQGVGVLALAQIAPLPGFSLGFPAAGLLAAGGALPAAALAGLALDLALVTKTPMTAVLCLSYLVRLVPIGSKWLRYTAPGVIYLLVMGLCGHQDLLPAAVLALGGGLAALLPRQPEITRRRGETGMAQVRLELMAGVLDQTRQLLLEVPVVPIDEAALAQKARERACGGCPCRKTCRQRLEALPVSLLHRPLFENTSLPIPCKKPGRMVLELRRSQEQLRTIRADRDRQAEYRWAVQQQYQFLANFLQQTADQLPRKEDRSRQRYRPEVAACSAGKEAANGDRCLWFAGTGYRYYVVLCDGMGTGLGAAQEGQTAGAMLRDMLTAGFPAEYALRSINSLLALREKAGAVTLDLAEIELDTGKASVYKWGAAPSWLLQEGTAEKIGTAGPPPGLSVKEGRETVQRLSLRRGEVLIMLSDGVDGEGALRRVSQFTDSPPGELAAKLVADGFREAEDDATAAVIRLSPGTLST
ncbi:MAG: SpoIIE family protein phosphatase [Oscillospiraceae bacterium]|nr:SpoIIE family protein phosphatase [Oscillospiraceae bacterium]